MYKRYEELQKKTPQVGDTVYVRELNTRGKILSISDDDITSNLYTISLENSGVILCNKGSFILVP